MLAQGSNDSGGGGNEAMITIMPKSVHRVGWIFKDPQFVAGVSAGRKAIEAEMTSTTTPLSTSLQSEEPPSELDMPGSFPNDHDSRMYTWQARLSTYSAAKQQARERTSQAQTTACFGLNIGQ